MQSAHGTSTPRHMLAARSGSDGDHMMPHPCIHGLMCLQCLRVGKSRLEGEKQGRMSVTRRLSRLCGMFDADVWPRATRVAC